jgi:AcrR family transcriptional regulator
MSTETQGARKVRRPTKIRKQQIVDAALRIIAARGLREFTIKAIGQEVGVTDAAVLRHLPTKNAIVQAAIDRVEQLLFEGFPPTDKDPLTRLGRFFCKRADTVTAHSGVAGLLFSEDLEHAGGPAEHEQIASFKRRSRAFLIQCLQEAQRQHLLTSDVAPKEGAQIVMGALMSYVFSVRGRRGTATAKQESARLWNTLEALLRAKASELRGKV